MKRLFSLLLTALLLGAVVTVGQISNPNARAPKTTKSTKPQNERTSTPKQEQKQKKQRSSSPSKINITINCNATAGSLYIDGKYYGKPNGSYKVNSGWHKISVEAKGYNYYECKSNSINKYDKKRSKSSTTYDKYFRTKQ